MDKRFVLFIALSVVILFGYNFLFQKSPKSSEPTQPQAQVITPTQQTQEKPTEIAETNKETPKNIQNITIANEKITFDLTSYGANLNQAIVRDFGHNVKESINLVDAQKNFLKTESIINGQKLNLNYLNWEVVKSNQSSVVFRSEPIENVYFYKSFDLKKDFFGTVSLEIHNQTDQPLVVQQSRFSWGPTHSADNQQYNQKQAVVLNVRKLQHFKSKKKEAVSTTPITSGWVGMKDQYFCAILYGADVREAIVYQHADQSLEIKAGFLEKTIPARDKTVYLSQFYIGPQNYDLLKQGDMQLAKIIDFGIFRFLAIPMLYLLKFFYNLTSNYGFAIILLTLVIRAILWWPTQKSYSSMKKMQTAMNKMQPRLKTLKELYKNNPAKLNEETMKMYKEYKINPMGGCLPMLLQMPVFFALYSTLTSAVELKGANFVWIWRDLSKSDPWYILPVAMGLSMFIQQKMSTPPSATPEAATQQKMMLYLLPAMLTFFSFMWPSGLLLYWVISNIVSIGQQLVINRQKE